MTRRAFLASMAACVILSGCAAPAPINYPVSGRVGLAVTSTSKSKTAGVMTSALAGGGIGLLQSVGIGALVFPGFLLLAPLVAGHVADCAYKLQAEITDVTDEIDSILAREFSPADLRGTLFDALSRRTSTQLVEIEMPTDVSSDDVQLRLGMMESRGLDYLLELELTRVGFMPNFDGKCALWNTRVQLDARLWKLSERRVVLTTTVNTFEDPRPIWVTPLSQLKPLLVEPGALRAHLLGIYPGISHRMLNTGDLKFPP